MYKTMIIHIYYIHVCIYYPFYKIIIACATMITYNIVYVDTR